MGQTLNYFYKGIYSFIEFTESHWLIPNSYMTSANKAQRNKKMITICTLHSETKGVTWFSDMMKSIILISAN